MAKVKNKTVELDKVQNFYLEHNRTQTVEELSNTLQVDKSVVEDWLQKNPAKNNHLKKFIRKNGVVVMTPEAAE